MKMSRFRTAFVTLSVLLIVAALLAIGIVTVVAGTNTIDGILPSGGITYTRLDKPVSANSYGKSPEENTERFSDLSTVDLLHYVLSFDDLGGYVLLKATRTYTEADVAYIAKDDAFLALCARADFTDTLELYAASCETGENVGTIAAEALPYVTLHPMTLNLLKGRKLTPDFSSYIKKAISATGLNG